MLEFYLNGQSMKMFSPVIAADSLNWLTAKYHFDAAWDGFTKTAHFRKQDSEPELVYDIVLTGDEIKASDRLNLTTGCWDAYVTGELDGARLTSTVSIIEVKASGLVDAPLHELPMSVAEQVTSLASTALLTANAVRDAADRGDFNGRDGTDGRGFTVAGYVESVSGLEAISPAAGEMYGVGTEEPYEIYAYDFLHNRWVDNGTIQGPPGETGADGAAGTTFIPSVDANGILSWTNDGGKENPQSVSIKGPKGDTGSAGPAGSSAYAAAVAGGYTGTELTFNTALSAVPYHNARHLPDGADPVTVQTGNLAAGAVTYAKLAPALHTRYIDIGTAAADWTAAEDGYYTASYTGVSGLLAADKPNVHFKVPASFSDLAAQQYAFNSLYDVDVTADGSITFYAKAAPDADFDVTLEVPGI